MFQPFKDFHLVGVLTLAFIFQPAGQLIFVPTGMLDAQAQETREKKEKPKGRRSQVLSKRAFAIVEAAQNRLAEEDYIGAISLLQQIRNGAKFTAYEKAIALQTEGFVHADQGNYAKTIQAFEKAANSGDLPPRLVSDLIYNLAQLNLAKGRSARALDYIIRWFATVEGEPTADAYGLKAQIHLVMDDLAAAEQAVRKALSKVEEPQQNWTRLLLSVLLQQERYGEARPILEDAALRWPSVKVFWQQLTAVYYEAKQEELAFVTQQIMHRQNMLKTSKELSSMAQLYLYHDIPIKAARVLQTGLDDGSIEKTEKNYELLAQAYMHAREWDKAIKPLTAAAKKSDKGRFYEQLGQSYLQDEKWRDAEQAFVNALEKGGLRDAANTWLLLGITRTRVEKWDAAIAAFRKAGDDDETAKDAFRWIRSIERQLAA
ncbi:MAG: tetratricopeptide repeat protein, partial [Pseudomonadota bacterium]|nr:tetratricopeptide repeat protein [Pseudomonadota bacterium]